MKKKPIIGLATKNIFWDGKGKYKEKAIEISSKDPSLFFRRKNLDKIKKSLKGKELSMHTQTRRIFTEKVLSELELSALKSEVLTCKFLGCKELIVHLKGNKLTKKEVETFKEILRFAKGNKVEILYEPNGKFNGKDFLYNLKQFNGLNVNLDLGHLNTAIENRTLAMNLEEFISKIRNKVVYVHAHNNSGEDDHFGLNDGTLDWKRILNMLDLSRVRKIIIELHDFSYYDSTKKALEEYLR